MGRIIPCKPNDICFYCGVSATGMDHVIPYCVNGHKTDAVPCCKECNTLLGSYVIGDCWQKKECLSGILQKRYRKELCFRDRSEHELNELGYNFRCSVESSMVLKSILEARVAFSKLGPENMKT